MTASKIIEEIKRLDPKEQLDVIRFAYQFEFDPQKSETNKAKHGIDFVTAQALWKSKHVVLGAKDALEKRYMVLGGIGAKHWSAIITYRERRFG